MPTLLLKFAPYIIVAVLAASASGYTIHHWDSASYSRLQATFEAYKVTDAVEAAKAHDAIEQQKVIDAQSAEGAISGLKNELESLRVSASQPVPHVRLCQYTTRNPLPASDSAAAATGTEPGPASPGSVPDVSTGAPVGPDIGAGLFRLAGAADLVSAEDRARLAYLRLVTAKKVPP
jgi:hypothetical protein